MSHISVRPITDEEGDLLQSLIDLAISGSNQGIAKISSTAFENRTFSGGGGGTWGSITGTLSAQTDLQAALDEATLGPDPESKTITRNASGFITSIAGATKTYTFTRNASNYVTSKTDSTNTWTYTRDGSNYITAVTVT